MDWEPYVGRKVRCVRDEWNLYRCQHAPKRGAIYTIRGVEDGPHAKAIGSVGLLLFEITNPVAKYGNWGTAEPSFVKYAFVPIDDRDTDISVFEEMLIPQPTNRQLIESMTDDQRRSLDKVLRELEVLR